MGVAPTAHARSGRRRRPRRRGSCSCPRYRQVVAREIDVGAPVPTVAVHRVQDRQPAGFGSAKETLRRLPMWKILKTRGVDLAITAIALIALMPEPAWATAPVPGPAVGGLAGAAIIGAIVIAKWWRRK